ncbi:MAG: hypothetical protein AAF357_05100, partial [Verrucomicrobiota bacterium]
MAFFSQYSLVTRKKGKLTPMKLRATLFLFAFSILSALASQAQVQAENWHQWRGPENNGVSRTAKPPLEWSESKN